MMPFDRANGAQFSMRRTTRMKKSDDVADNEAGVSDQEGRIR